MDQQNQPTPVVPETAPAAPQQAPAAPQAPAPQKSTPVWVWLLGGCLGIILITMIAIGGLGWWAARKVKNELKNAQPKLEEWQKNAEKMSNDAEKWQKEMEKIQNQIPEVPTDANSSLE